jgi:hypothetical protein
VPRLEFGVESLSNPPGKLPLVQGWRGPGSELKYHPFRSTGGFEKLVVVESEIVAWTLCAAPHGFVKEPLLPSRQPPTTCTSCTGAAGSPTWAVLLSSSVPITWSA